MTTATSGIIDINGQVDSNGRVNKCGGELTIARSMPVVLTGCMNDFVWANFCDKIDETLVPISQVNRRVTICQPICVLLLGSSIIACSNNEGGVPFIIAIFLTIVSSCWAQYRINKALMAKGEVCEAVCEAESAKHPDISFHFISSLIIYIEVSVLNNAGPGRLAYGQGNVAEISTIPVVSAVPVALSTPPAFNPVAVAIPEPEFDIEAGNKKSPAERMRTLEDMKGLLSEEEYQRKRAEIVSDV